MLPHIRSVWWKFEPGPPIGIGAGLKGLMTAAAERHALHQLDVLAVLVLFLDARVHPRPCHSSCGGSPPGARDQRIGPRWSPYRHEGGPELLHSEMQDVLDMGPRECIFQTLG